MSFLHLLFTFLCFLALAACTQPPQSNQPSDISEFEFLPDGVLSHLVSTPRLVVRLAIYKDSINNERMGKVVVAWSDPTSHLTGHVDVKLRQAGQSNYLTELNNAPVNSTFMAPTILLTSGTHVSEPLCIEVTGWDLSATNYTFSSQNLPLVFCHKNTTETGADVAVNLDINSKTSVTINQTFPFLIATQNLGKYIAKDVVVTLTLPSALEFVSHTSLAFDCAALSPTEVRCARNRDMPVTRWGLPITLKSHSVSSDNNVTVSINTSSIDPNPTNNTFTQSITVTPEALCPTDVQTNEPFECQLPTTSETYTLTDAPAGMVVQPRSGFIRWTPTVEQTGSYQITTNAGSFNLTVNSGNPNPAGIYVSPEGNDANSGSAIEPLKTIQEAVDRATPGSTIYIRGGIYYNAEYQQPFAMRRTNGIAKITVSGTAESPITLRAFGNEFVKLISDESGLIFNAANYWIVDGLELEGSAQALNYNLAMQDWWADDNSRTGGRGITNADSQHITIQNCIVHDFPGSGVGSNGADFVHVKNNVIYNNGWWTTAGTHGVSNSYLTTTDPSTADQEKLVMEGNLVFGNQSLIISHVFSKGRVALTIDEGNGLHAQNNSRTFQGKARVENNLLLFNGKAGFGINTMDDVIVKNNAFYQNARVVTNAGELILKSSSAKSVVNNLFVPRTNRRTIKDSSDLYTNVGNNATVASNLDSALPSSVLHLSQVFQDPANNDFTGIPEGMGVPKTELERMSASISAYGIDIIAPTQMVDADYLHTMKQYIFDNWPASWQNLILEDEATGFEYTYAQRCQYPAAPSASICP
jgi:uncharacterized repeat protein (TIGR01451 family)